MKPADPIESAGFLIAGSGALASHTTENLAVGVTISASLSDFLALTGIINTERHKHCNDNCRKFNLTHKYKKGDLRS